MFFANFQVSRLFRVYKIFYVKMIQRREGWSRLITPALSMIILLEDVLYVFCNRQRLKVKHSVAVGSWSFHQ